MKFYQTIGHGLNNLHYTSCNQANIYEGHRIAHCKNLAVLPFLYLLYVSETVDKWTHFFLWKYCIFCLFNNTEEETTFYRKQRD